MSHALGRSSLGDESVGSEDNDCVRTAFYWLVVGLGAPASPWASVSSSAKMSTLTMPDVRGCLGSKSHKVPVSCYFINATYYYHYDIYNFCWYNFLYFLFGNNFKLTSTKNTCLSFIQLYLLYKHLIPFDLSVSLSHFSPDSAPMGDSWRNPSHGGCNMPCF